MMLTSFVRQHSSNLPPGGLRRHLEDLGDFLFSDVRSPSLLQGKTADGKQKVPEMPSLDDLQNFLEFQIPRQWALNSSGGVYIVTENGNTGPPKQALIALNSGVYPDDPPVLVHSGKLLKYVETAEVVRGPHDYL
ncbi:hypothetical protein LR48_Vigan10g135100 [Vigna angularis]|uniref:Uncharacterized protein n=1 Tax=Phaseolus angularis TaxID=3914 RepID=A0A0L9VL74_PHAAN|nr:hypothetical protein LR48_Vigan10g135100 [Vigna angularis]